LLSVELGEKRGGIREKFVCGVSEGECSVNKLSNFHLDSHLNESPWRDEEFNREESREESKERVSHLHGDFTTNFVTRTFTDAN
jgi:hypothetical protein